MPTYSRDRFSRWGALSGAAAVGAAAAIYNRIQTKRAERATPPAGEFIQVGDATLHYLRAGAGPKVVLLHGNGLLLQDWLVSGIFDELTKSHEVIAFDRPGFGYSSRPRGSVWTPQAQAEALAGALSVLAFGPAVVVGHSLGALVALAFALDYPQMVSRLVLLGGLYFPTPRPDALLNAMPAIPVVGDVMRYTISPIAARLALPTVEKLIFAPGAVPARWETTFPKGMIMRPTQLRATAADSGLALPAAEALSKRYTELAVPVHLLAGEGDKIVNPHDHSERLHGLLPGARLSILAGTGHMVHYTRPELVIDAIE